MDSRRTSVPMTNSDGGSNSGIVSGGTEIVPGEGQRTGEPGRDMIVNENVGTKGLRRNSSVGELSKRRRHANDPAMMRELKRYQRLMLLTSLPLISSEDDLAYPHPHAHTHHLNSDLSTLRFPSRISHTPDIILEKSDTTEVDKNHNEHLPKPEPTDAIASGPISPLSKSPQQAKSAGVFRAGDGKSLSSAPASAGTRLPLTVYNPLNLSPKRNHRRKSQDENGKVRKRSQEDVAKEVADVGGRSGGGGGGGTAGGGNGGYAGGGAGGELDLLTLTALYLESRHRVFGQEWHYRPENPANHRPVGLQPLGSTGISRPRRLTPLSPSKELASNSKRPLEHRRSFCGVIPAPAGLHLSVNYTQNLGLDETEYLEKRARALKPRLRRLNSMEDIAAVKPMSSPEHSLHRPTSAPDLSHGNNGKHHHNGRRDSQTSRESFSPTLATPARANTPTEAKQSAALAKPQIVGGSLATYTAIEPSKPLNNIGGGAVGVAATAVVEEQTAPRTRTRTLSEEARPTLQPPVRTGRLPGLPAEPLTLEHSVLDLPKAPPPSASVENHRRPSRVHLEPLTIRKSSQ